MKSVEELKDRNIYLDKLVGFQNTDWVKVITGIRRCGKSSLLRLMAQHLRDTGVDDSQIIEMNFESYAFKDMTEGILYNYVSNKIVPHKKMYLFFDELQRIENWESAVNALRVDFDTDIYVTGSNAYLLSSEYSTYLAGRSVEVKMLPLSFGEFVSFHGFRMIEKQGLLGDKKRIILDSDGVQYTPREIFDAYMHYGGMPSIADVGLNQEKAYAILDGIYNTVVIRDILEREKRRYSRRITDQVLLEKIVLFLADNIGNNVSSTSIGNTLMSEGLLNNRTNKGTPGKHTVQDYVHALIESYFYYPIKRFDIKGKEYLKTLGKYYIVDIGLRNYLLGFRDRDRGHAIENIVYFELIRRGYDVAIGKIDTMEIDFIATNGDEKKYIQVTESMTNDIVRERELKPLKKVADSYEKIVLSLDTGMDNDYDGIKSINIIDWLLEC